MNHPATQLTVRIQEGEIAPRYPAATKELVCKTAVITEKGMTSGLPLVDLQLVDEQGNEYFVAMTGRIVNALAASIKGVNLRNHGAEEP